MPRRAVPVICLLCVAGLSFSQAPDDCSKAERVLSEAHQLYSSGRTTEALKKAKSAVKKAPRCAPAHLLLGHCQWEVDEAAEAERSYATAFSLDPSLIEARVRLEALTDYKSVRPAATALKENRWGEALEAVDKFVAGGGRKRFEIAIRQIATYYRPRTPECFPALMEMYRDAGRYRECLFVAACWSALCSQCEFDITTELATAYLESGEVGKAAVARVQLEQLLETAPLVESPNQHFLTYCGWSLEYPQILRQGIPSYTDAAIARNINGTAVLEAVVDLDGRMKNIRLLKSLEPSLDENAMDTIRRTWLFRPGTVNGRPVRLRAPIEVTFRLSFNP